MATNRVAKDLSRVMCLICPAAIKQGNGLSASCWRSYYKRCPLEVLFNATAIAFFVLFLLAILLFNMTPIPGHVAQLGGGSFHTPKRL